MQSLKIICPNGHLGLRRYAPPASSSAWRPDRTTSPPTRAATTWPVPLGADVSTSPESWQRHDLEQMLLAARKIGAPMIIGSSGDTGSNSRVDLYVRIIKELAAKHGLKKFRLGYFYSEVDPQYLRAKIRAGDKVLGLDGRPELAESELDATQRIVAMAGVHPFIALLKQGVDVIIGGRSSDAAIFAAPRFITASRKTFPMAAGRCLNARRSATSPTAARGPCWARYRRMT